MKHFLSYLFLCLINFSVEASTVKVSDHFDGTHFYNLDGKSEKGFLDVLKWKLTSVVESWSGYPNTPIKYVTPENKIDTGAKITFIGHASFLVQLNGLNILTDPVWSKRASPFSFLGPQRYTELPIELDKLPKIDIVLVSHNHYDHMDKETLSFLGKRDNPLFVVPLKNQETLESFGLKKIVELDWWESYLIDEEIEITMLPARHWSRRSLRDTNKSLWGSFLISGDKQIYFAGDTGFGKHFDLIAKKHPIIDVALIPIGAYEPRWFMKEAHMNPEDALDAHLILKPKLSIGMHFGTFQLTDEGPLKPIEDLEKICSQKMVGNFIAPTIGQEFRIEK